MTVKTYPTENFAEAASFEEAVGWAWATTAAADKTLVCRNWDDRALRRVFLVAFMERAEGKAPDDWTSERAEKFFTEACKKEHPQP